MWGAHGRYREPQKALTLHLATATVLDCDELHTGDGDFDGVEEVAAVVH